MSKCISNQGEYSEHDMAYEGDVSLGEFVCTRCYVFDEESALEELVKLRATVASRERLIRDLTDTDPCWFDHHGGCQAHGYLSLDPGETCPMHDAQQIYNAALEGGDN